MSVPRVSVLMTVYNAAPFLRESVGSVLAQSFPDWELVIVDDGSTDGSAQVLAEYADPRVRVFLLSKNIGRTSALRHGFDQAHGEYIAVLDADDIAHPQRLMREVEFLDVHSDTVLVGSWAREIDRDGKVIGTREPPVAMDALYDSLASHNLIAHSSIMYRKKAAETVGGYPQQYRYAQDLGLMLLLAQKGKIAVINEPLCLLRIIQGSMTHSSAYRFAVVAEEFDLMRRAGELLPLGARGKGLNRKAVARREFRYGRELFFHGKFFAGMRMMVSGAIQFLLTPCFRT